VPPRHAAFLLPPAFPVLYLSGKAGLYCCGIGLALARVSPGIYVSCCDP
jgi:hypothetical protein